MPTKKKAPVEKKEETPVVKKPTVQEEKKPVHIPSGIPIVYIDQRK
jgi:hypothetical protein